ncbi:hypothetical protein GCM10023339_71370 [Alloalcanivorax gelatiniphagus]
MAYVPLTRAPALPTGEVPADDTSTPFRALAHHARTRGGTAAYVVRTGGQERSRSWAEVADVVEQAGAGLVRSGLRSDQVVVSLLPAAHPYPELDLALRVIGAVVVNVSPLASGEDLARDLAGVDVRLVVAEAEADLDRLGGLTFARAALFALDGGRGWQHLLRLGAERLTMDPDVVARVDQVVDPAGAVPRLLRAGEPLVRLVAGAAVAPMLRAGEVGVVVGHHSDPLVQLVHEAHLASGATLVGVADGTGLAATLADRSPAVLAVASGARAALTAGVRRVADDLGLELAGAEAARLLPGDLPVPLPVLRGDAAVLPRRSRRDPGRDFQLATERERVLVDDAASSAFALPSLPLFGGESFLDRLLIAQARAGTP